MGKAPVLKPREIISILAASATQQWPRAPRAVPLAAPASPVADKGSYQLAAEAREAIAAVYDLGCGSLAR